MAHLRAIYGLDQPILLRYWHWLAAALQGDFGFSRTHAQPVMQVLLPALWQTCQLMLASFVVSLTLAMTLGIAAALKPGGILDGVVSLFAFAGISVPVFWLALVLILVVAVKWHALPASGISTVGDGSALDHLRHLILPVTTLALASTGQFTRFVRASMIEAMRMDHIRTARRRARRNAGSSWCTPCATQ